MCPPLFKGVFALRQKVVALVYGRDARDRSGLVVKNFIGDMRCNPQPGHPGHAGPTQIMQAPAGYARELIE